MMNTTNKNSMKGRWVACMSGGITLLTILLLFMTGTRAFGQYSLTNPGGITINNDATSNGEAVGGYPSTVSVPTNVAGNLEKVTVTINGFTHGYPNDVELLLVAPNGSTVALMGNDGAGIAVNNLTLTFDDVAAGAATLGVATPLTSTTYKSGDNSSYGTTQPFPGLTNLANATLASFVGATPANYEGTWSLYVLDDSLPAKGSITSWSLNLYTLPAVAVTNTSVTVAENQSTNLYFTASDTSSNATLTPSVNITAVNTSNIGYTNGAGSFPNVVSASDFKFSAISANGTNFVTITPNANLYGTATFTINLIDSTSNVVSSAPVTLTVTHVAVQPKIALANTTITTSEAAASGTNFISLISLDGNPGSSLILSVQATNGIGNVGVSSNVFTNIVGLPAATPPTIGITNNFYFSIVPGGFPIGTSYLNFIVTDPIANLSATQVVTVVVNPLNNGALAGPLVYSNTNAVNLQAGQGGATFGPISATNLANIGAIGRVSVSLLGVTNIIPSGLQLALVAPDGTAASLLLSSAGNSPSTYAELTFADSVGLPNVQGSDSLPGATTSTGSALLTNYVLNAVGGATALANAFAGHSITNTGAANEWSLYISDYSGVPFGISGGWVLEVYPAPVVVEPAQGSITIPESATTNIVFITSDTVGVPSGLPAVTLTPAINPNYSDTALAAFTVLPIGSNAVINGTNFTVGTAIINGTNYATNIVKVTANPNEAGTATVTLVATETNGIAGGTSSTFTATNTVLLTVSFVPQAPSIGFIENQVTFAGQAVLNLPFVIGSPDTNAAALTVTVNSSNPTLLPTSSAQDNAFVNRGASSGSPPATVPAGSPSYQTNYLSLFPVGSKGGESIITVSVSDGVNVVSTNFLLLVEQAGTPLFSNPNQITGITPNTNGTPYPSPVLVQNLVGTVENVVVTVFDVGYSNAAGLNLVLVGPTNATGQSPAVFLMGNAGGNTALTSANLIFSNSLASLPDTNASVLPQNAQINSDAVYIPTNYSASAYTTQIPVGSATVAPPAPGAGGYGTNLVSSFAGINPNGTWNLYAFDTNGVKGGAIFGGWQLSIITAPHVSPTTNFYTAAEEFAPLNVVIPVGDAEANNTTLTVTAVVTSPTTPSINVTSPILVTNNGVANLAVLNVTSIPYHFGTNNILVTATDASGNTSSANVQFVVTYYAQPPVILLTNVSFSTPAGVPISGIPFAVWDAQSTNNNSITATSTGLTPAPIISVVPGPTVGGTNSYTLTVQPVGVQPGTANITISVTDGVGQSAKTNIFLLVAPNQVYQSSSPISFPYPSGFPTAQAVPANYPSGITVSNVGGLVSGVEVSLIGFTHNDASDIAVLLVSPDQQHAVLLMANAGDQAEVNNVNLEFGETATLALPEFTPLTNGTYLPANYISPASSLVFSNLPAGLSAPYSTSLNTFDGVQPDGTWNLYVLDLGFPDSGSISSWMLYLQTGPAIASIPTQKVAENTTLSLPVTITDSSTTPSNVTVTITNGSGAAITSSSTPIAITAQGAGSPSGVTNLLITPKLNYPSTIQSTNATNSIFITVSDNHGNTATTSFTLIVQNINQPPVIVPSTTNLVFSENSAASITFTVSDVDSTLSYSNLSLVTTDSGLVAANGIVTNANIPAALSQGTTGTANFTIMPVANTFGTNQGTLLFTISDGNGNTVTTNITVSIIHVIQAPTIGSFTNHYQQFTGTTTNIPFFVGTAESNATLTVTASSSNPSALPNSPLNLIVTPSSFFNVAPNNYSGNVELIVPSGATPGSTIIYITNTQVAYGTTNVVVTSFTNVVLSSPTTVFANTAPISNVNATNGVASPYASSNTVSGLIGGIYSVNVTLNAFSASNPKDVSILLAAPNGTSVLLLSGAGGSAPSQNLTLSFADSDSLPPVNSPLTTNGGAVAYHPTGYNGNTNALPTNAPAPPYFDRLAIFQNFSGAALNGVWTLWVVDNTTGNTVSISNGWALSITTAPEISLGANQLTIAENAPGQNNEGSIAVNIVDGSGGAPSDNLIISSSPTPPASLFATNIISTTSSAPDNVDYSVTFVPSSLVSGTNTITFTVTRADGAFDIATATVIITKSNIPPVLTRLGPISVNENTSGRSEFFVTEIGDPLSDVYLSAYSSSQSIIANSNITFSSGSTALTPGLFNTNQGLNLASFASSVPNSGDVILNLVPNSGAVGTATITVQVANYDGAFNSPQLITSNFLFTVAPQAFTPTFANVPAAPPSFLSVIEGSTANISFQVNSQDASAPQVTVTATNLSAPSGVTVGAFTATQTAGSTWTVPITLGTSATKSLIQLIATDSNGKSVTNDFQINPVPAEPHFYSNTNPISIVDVSPSIPSPSAITVSNFVGLLSQVVVTINGFQHQYPSDVGILLVGPTGTNTVLMNNAGSGFPVSGLTLTFSNNSAGPAPASQPLSTASYSPSDYQPIKPYNFETSGPNNLTPPSPLPPNGPYPTNLGVFNGTSPNGTWNLYVQDDSAGDVGMITNGWSLQLVTQPTIQLTSSTPVSFPENSPSGGQVTFSIMDDSAAGAINYSSSSFSVTSSNSAVIAPANVSFNGSGTTWTANFTNVPNASGTTLLTITSANVYGQMASASFLVTVTAIPFPPTISQPGGIVTINAGTPTLIPLVYSDAGFTSATNTLIVSATTSPLGAQNPLPNSSLTFVANGSGPSNLFVTPVGNLTGSNLVTLVVTQPSGSGLSSTNTFIVNVVAGTVPLFVNTTPLAINPNSPASIYPSQITVSGVGGNVAKVTATLIGFSHTFPSDVSALLVGPEGQSVMLMSDEGSGIPVSNLRLTFDDAGGTMAAEGPLTSGTNAPALSDLNYIENNPDIVLPNAPSNSLPNPRYSHNLSVFSNTAPNGIWSLYVYDDNQPDSGSLSGGWALNIETIGPMITPIAPVSVNENSTVTVPFSISSIFAPASNITVTASVNSEIPTNLISNLAISGEGTGNLALTITPTPNYPSSVYAGNGTATITLVSTDTNHNYSSTNSFQLTVVYESLVPVLAPIANTNTYANVPVAVPLQVSDSVVAISNLVYSVNIANPTVVSAVNFSYNGSAEIATIVPAPNQTGGSALTITVSDGVHTASQTFTVTISAPPAPTFGPVLTQITPENTSVNVTLNVTDSVIPVSNLNYSVTLPNPSVVQAVNFSFNGSSVIATIVPVPFASGVSTITIHVSNGVNPTISQNVFVRVTAVEFPPTLAAIPNTNTAADVSVNVTLAVTDPVVPINDLSYSATIGNPSLIGAVNFSFNGTSEIATVVPVPGQTGSSTITISVSDGITNASESFIVLVFKPAPPTLGPILNQITPQNTPVSVVLNLTDPVTSISNLAYSATITSPSVVGSVNFTFNGTSEVATIIPAPNATGASTISINVSDGINPVVSQPLYVTVSQVDVPPTLAPIANTNTTAGVPVNVVLQVTDTLTSINFLNYSASIVNSSVIQAVNFSFNGTSEIATIMPLNNNVGSSGITINVNDGVVTVSQSFTVNVNPATGPTLTGTLVNGVLKITFTGSPGVTYTIQSSSDLLNWSTAGTVTANASTGAGEYDASVSNSSAAVFYRAQAP